MPFVWVTNVGVGASIDAADRNETKTNIAALYTALGANWPGNVRFPGCGGAGFDMAAPCPVVWDIAVGDSIYQTPTAHPVSELQEARDKLDWIWDNKCVTENAAFDSGEDFGEDIGANVGEDTGEDVGDNVGANAGEDVGENVGADAGANVGANTVEDVGADVAAQIGADIGQNVGADIGADVGENVAEQVNENSGAFAIHDGLHDAGACTTDDSGYDVAAENPNWVANDITDLQIVLVADFGCPGYWALVNINDH